MRKRIGNILKILMVFCLLFTSIAYSGLAESLAITTEAKIYAIRDIRVTGINLYNASNGAVESYSPQYNTDITTTGFKLTSSSSSITYKVTVNNYGNTDQTIYEFIKRSVNNSNVNFEIIDYNAKDIINHNSAVSFLIKFTTTSPSSQDINLVMHYDFREVYTISYDANGGDNAPGIQRKYAKEDMNITEDVPTRPNYDFLGWSTSNDSTTVQYSPNSVYDLDKDMTLYAVWQKKTAEIDLNYNVDGTWYNSGYNRRILTGIKIDGVDKGYLNDFSGTFDYGTSYEIYGFKLDNVEIPYSKKYTVDGKNYLNITFNTINITSNNENYGSVSVNQLIAIPGTTFKATNNIITLSDGRTITASVIDKDGYTTKFDNFEYSSATINTKTNVTANFIRKANKYTITLDDQNGTTKGTTEIYEKYDDGIYLDSSLTKKMTSSTNAITKPEKIGYTFKGYYTKKNGQGDQIINSDGYITDKITSTSYTSNTTLYAYYVDDIAPSNLKITNSSNGNWTNKDVTVTISATDEGSGIKEYQWKENGNWTTRSIGIANGIGKIIYTVDRNLEIEFRAVDNAGNISDVIKTSVKRDTVLPKIELNGSASSSEINNDNTITIPIKITEKASGINSSDFTASDINILINGTVVTPKTKTLIYNNVSNGVYSYTLTIGGVSANGKLTLEIGASAIKDIATNTNEKTTLNPSVNVSNTYEITLNNNGADTAGTNKIYEKYGVGIYLDQDLTKSMGEGTNPITKPEKSYTVSYDANGTDITVPSASKVNYKFNGYYTATSNGTQRINGDGYITSNINNTTYASNGTLYARWTKGLVTIPTISKTGYTCLWNTSKDGSGTSYNPGDITDTLNSQTLYARCNANALNFDEQTLDPIDYSDEKDQTLSIKGASNGTGSYTYSFVYGSSEFEINGTTITVKKGTNANSYTLLTEVIDNNSGTSNRASIHITINKIAAKCPIIKSYEGDYDGQYHKIEISGDTDSIQFRTSTTGSWTNFKYISSYISATSSPQIFYLKNDGDFNHTEADCGSASVTINKKKLAISDFEVNYTGNKYFWREIETGVGKETLQLSYRPTLADKGTYNYDKKEFTLSVDNGTYTGDKNNYEIAKVGDLIIGQAKGEISYSTKTITKTYGDSAFINSLTKTGDGTVKYTSSNENVATVDAGTGKVTIVGAGTATIIATVTDGTNYTYATKTATYTLTVNKADNPVKVTANTLTYKGKAQNLVTISNNQGNICYSTSAALTSCTSQGTIPTGTNAGTYTVYYYAAGNGDYKVKSGSVSVTINKANGSIEYKTVKVTKTYGDGAFTNELTKTGDGTVKYTSSNVNVATINSSSGEITIKGAGTTTITATVTDGTNYTYSTNIASYSLIVSTSSNPISVTANTLTYNGKTQNLVTTKNAIGNVCYSLSSEVTSCTSQGTIPAKTDAGTYTVYYYAAGNTNYSSVKGNVKVTISKKTITPNAYTVTYDGNKEFVRTYTTGILSETLKLTYTSYAATAGTYGYSASAAASKYTLAVADGNGKASNYNVSNPGTLTINKKAASISYATKTVTKTYGDAAFTNAITNTGDGNITYTSSNAKVATIGSDGKVTIVGAGTATITATVTDGTNYTYATKTATYTLTVNKADNPVKVTANTLIYNGNAQDLVTVSNINGNICYSTSVSVTSCSSSQDIPQKTDAGTYTVYYYVSSSDNYKEKKGSASVIISKKTITPNAYTVTYDSNKKFVRTYTTGILSETLKLTYTSYAATAGTYSYSASAAASKYTLAVADGSGKASNYNISNPGTLTINKKAASISYATKTVTKTYGDAAFTNAITNTGNGTIKYTSSNVNVATVDVSNGKVTIIGAGTATITGTVTDGTNYTYATKTATYTLTVNKADNPVKVTPITLTYNTQAQNLVTTTNAQGNICYSTSAAVTSCTSQGTIPTGTNAGTYTVYYYVAGNSNYKAKSGSVSVTINKYNLSNASISGISSKTYDGTEQKQSNFTVTVPIPTGKTSTPTYTTSYSNNINVGTATMTLTGTGNYTGTKSATFNITQKESACVISKVPTLKYPSSASGTIEYSCTGDGKITISSGSTNIITVSNASNTSATLTASATGTSKITVSQAVGTNYKASTVSTNVIVTYSSYTVTLNGNGATTNGSTSTTATYNSTSLPTITLPKREYTITYNMGSTGLTKPSNGSVVYSFGGWYTAASNGTKVASNSTTPALIASVNGYTNSSKQWTKTSNATLYAGWTEGSTTLASISSTGNSCTWNTKSDGSGTSYALGYTGFKTSSNITLYAQCSANSYVLTVNPNNGTNAYTVTQGYGTTYTVAIPTRKGYTFSSWTLTGKGTLSGNVYTFSDGAGNLSANWNKNTYKITYDLNGGSLASEVTNKTSYDVETDTFTLNNPSKKGYVFTGWTGSNGTTPQTTVTISKGSIDDRSYKANFEPQKIKLTLDPSPGTGGTKNIWYYYGISKFYSDEACSNEITAITKPTRTGYTFTSYYGDGTSGGNNGERFIAYESINFADDLATDIYKDATLYANWSISSYTVTYDYKTNGGTTSNATSSVYYESSVDLSRSASKSGYEFVGWNTNKDATTGLTSYNMPAKNVTLYAIYKKTLTATFNYYNSKSEKKEVTIYNNVTSGSVTSPEALGTPSGYTFRHYSTSNVANASKTVGTNEKIVLTSDQSYYASYQKTTTVNFYYHSGNDTTNTQSSTTGTGIKYLGYNGSVVDSDITIPTAVTNSIGYYGTSYKGVTAKNSTTPIDVNTGTTDYYAYYQVDIMFHYYFYGVTRRFGSRIAYSNGTNYITTVSGEPTITSTGRYDGDTFKGWSVKTDSIDYVTPSKSSATDFYAVSEKSVSVTFYYYNGASVTGEGIRNYLVTSDDVNQLNSEVEVPSEVKADVNKYKYRGVSTSSSGDATIVTPTTKYDKYYASYAYTIKISFDANGGTGTGPATITGAGYMSYGGGITGLYVAIPDNTFTRSGYSFSTWNTAANWSGSNRKVGDKYTFTEDETLYAQWSATSLKFDDQTLDPIDYSDERDQTLSIKGASNGTGSYTYSFVYGSSEFEINGTTITVKKGTNANSYTLLTEVIDNNSGASARANIRITINKIAAKCPTIKSYEGDYDGQYHKIEVSGDTDTIKYRTSTTGEWNNFKYISSFISATSSPQIFYLKNDGDFNHTEVDCGSASVTINKKKISISDFKPYYSGSAFFGTEFTTGVKDETLELSYHANSANGGTYSYGSYKNEKEFTLTVEGGASGISKDNYEIVSVGILKIEPKNASINFVQSSVTKIYGNIPFTNSLANTGDGTVKYTSNKESVAEVDANTGRVSINGAGTAIITATVTETIIDQVTNDKNYTYPVKTATYTLTVDKANNPTKVSGNTLTYNGKTQNLVTTSNVQGNICFSLSSELTSCNKTEDIPTGTNAGDYKVYYYVKGNDNYKDTSGSVIAKIYQKKASCPSMTSYSATYDTNSHGIGISGGSGGTIQYRTSTTDSWTTKKPEITNVGSITTYVQVYGDSNHTTVDCGSRDVVISKYNLSNATIGSISNQTYTGKSITPTVNATVPIPSGKTTTLTNGTDFTTSYSNNTEPGTATATITAVDSSNYTGTKSKTFIIDKIEASISYTTKTVTKKYGNAKFTNTLTKTGDGTVKYTSSNANVANVDASTGEVTINGAGTATITATVTDGTYYKYTSNIATYSLTVDKADNPVKVTANTLTYNGQAQNLVTVSGAIGNVCYSTSTALTSCTSQGTIPTGTNAGTYIVYYYAKGNNNYKDTSGNASVSVTIKPKAASISYATKTVEKTYGDTAFTNAITNTGDGTVKYTSSNTSAATIGSDGKVTIVGVGTTTITATVTDGINYTYATKTATYTLTVKAKDLTGSVKISGSATGGSTLTATVTNTNSATLKYQWYYTDNEKATGGTAITNATANTYVIDTSLLGKYIYVVVTASKVNYNTATWTDITTTPISSSKLSTPTNIKVSTEGIVTWDSVQNATGYEISIDNTNWISASSGINYNDVITKTTDDKIVYVKATADKYADSDSGKSSTVKVYSLTLKKETGISKVTGNGNYISGRTVSISATATSGYTFGKWTGATVTNASSANTTVKVTAATTVTATATANVYTVTLNSKNEKIDSSDSWTLSSDSSTATKKITFNTAYGNLPNASKDGYSFEGWFTESGTQITSTSTFNVAGNQTLYAHYLSAPVIDGGSAEWAQSRTITVATDATSDTGISKYQYYLSTSNSSLDGGTWTDLSSSKSETFTSTMSKYIYFRAVSTNGTEGPISNYQVVRIDVQKPSATITGYKAGIGTAVRTNTWSDTVLNFMFKSEDIHHGGSGVTIYYCGDTTNTCSPSKIATKDTAIDDYQNTVTMPFYVRYKLISGSGVESGIGSYTARVDTVTPSATITGYKAGSSTEVASGVWSDTGLNFTFYDKNVKKGKSGGTIKYCFDRENTCKPSYEYSSNITNLNNLEGHFYIRYQITSGAGKSSNVFSHIANVDTVTPSVDILAYKAGVGTTVSSGTWSNTGLNFKFQNVKCGASTCTIKYCGDRNNTCTPNTSVSVSNAGNAITTWNGLTGTYYVRYTISSQAQTTRTDVYTARVDTDNPTYSISRSGSTVTATCSDKTSSVSGGKTITLSSSNKAISGTCTDSAGNTTSYYKSYTYSQSGSACGYKYNVITTDCKKEGGEYVSPSYCGGSATNCCAIPKSCWH